MKRNGNNRAMVVSKTQIPEGWRLVRLGDVVRFKQGGTPSKARPEFWDGEIPFVTGADLRETRISRDNARSFLTNEGLHSGATAICKEGALLLATRTRVGLVGIAAEMMGASQDITLLAPTDAADQSYLYRTLLNNADLLQQRSRGTTIQGVSREDIDSLPILLPPLTEQRAIAAVLDAIDDAIERTDAVITATEQLRDSLLHELLTRGVPGWHTEWKEAPELGTIPADWEVVRLGEVVTVASGQSDPKAAKFQGSLFVAPDDIESGTGRLINRRTVAEAHAISGKYRFDKFEVLYSKIRPYLMKVYRPHESGLCSADIYPLRPKSMLEAAYLALALLSLPFTDYTRTCSDRTGIPKINRIDLFKYRLTLPSLPEQRTIAAMLDGVAGTIARARGERDRFRSLKEATADALLTGRVRVGGS